MTQTVPAPPSTTTTPNVVVATVGIEPAPAGLRTANLAYLRHAGTAIVLRFGTHAEVLAVDTDPDWVPARGDTRTWQARFVDLAYTLAAAHRALFIASQWLPCGWCGLPQSGALGDCNDEFGHRGLFGQRETTWRGPVDSSVDADLIVWSPR